MPLTVVSPFTIAGWEPVALHNGFQAGQAREVQIAGKAWQGRASIVVPWGWEQRGTKAWRAADRALAWLLLIVAAWALALTAVHLNILHVLVWVKAVDRRLALRALQLQLQQLAERLLGRDFHIFSLGLRDLSQLVLRLVLLEPAGSGNSKAFLTPWILLWFHLWF